SFDYFFAIDFETNFDASFNRNILNLIEEHKRGTRDEYSDGVVNSYEYGFIIENKDKCKSKQEDSFETGRNQKHVEHQFLDVRIKRVFVLDSCEGVQFKDLFGGEVTCEDVIEGESMINNDIIQINFIDTHHYDTMKMMIAQKWAMKNCPNAEFILFVDDNFYVSMKNLLNFVLDPFTFEKQPNFVWGSSKLLKPLPSNYDGRLYAGYVHLDAKPIRNKLSKRRVSLQEYRYSHYPPYVDSGTIILSKSALIDIYYASLYVKHFRLVDIYIGMLARIVKIKPLHSSHVFTSKLPYSKQIYSTVIASRGFNNYKQLEIVWQNQKRLKLA
ncbi:Beta-1:3-galactosyltransferase brn-like protein, partial [Dinothrombium tinctorium]